MNEFSISLEDLKGSFPNYSMTIKFSNITQGIKLTGKYKFTSQYQANSYNFPMEVGDGPIEEEFEVKFTAGEGTVDVYVVAVLEGSIQASTSSTLPGI